MFNGAFLGVIFAGVDIGLAIGIGLSVIIAFAHTAFPRTVRLGNLPGTHVYRCASTSLLCLYACFPICHAPTASNRTGVSAGWHLAPVCMPEWHLVDVPEKCYATAFARTAM